MKIQTTKDYELFKFSKFNREVSRYRSDLVLSMSNSGWRKSQPMICKPTASGQLIVMDGQNRFNVAKSLGIPVSYVIDNSISKHDISSINSSQKKWTLGDYEKHYCSLGNKNYKEFSKYRERTKISADCVFALLNGGSKPSQTFYRKFKSGKMEWVDNRSLCALDLIVLSLRDEVKHIRKRSVVLALARAVLIDEFDVQRFISKAKKFGSFIENPADVEYAARNIETVYNYHSKNKTPLAYEIINLELKQTEEQA